VQVKSSSWLGGAFATGAFGISLSFLSATLSMRGFSLLSVTVELFSFSQATFMILVVACRGFLPSGMGMKEGCY
jgi:hypothetical protein